MSYLITCILLLTAPQELPPGYDRAEFGIDEVQLIGTFVGIAKDEPGEVEFWLYFPRGGDKGIHLLCTAQGKEAKRMKRAPIGALVIVTGHHVWRRDTEENARIMIQADKLYWLKQRKGVGR